MLAWLDLTGCAFSLRPIHWFQYTSCPTFSQCYVTSKVLQFWWTICLDNSSANCNDHRSRNCPSSYTNSTTSFTFTRNSVDSGIIIFFFFFKFFLPVIYWCSYKGIFRIFFPKFLQRRFGSMYQSVLELRCYNWGWMYDFISLLMIDISAWLTLPDPEDGNGGIRLSIVILRYCFVKISQISNFCHIADIIQLIRSLFCAMFSLFKNMCRNNFDTPASMVLP